MATDSSSPLAAAKLRVPDRAAILQRAKKLVRKFGPLTLIIILLFAIKYFLLGIHLNVHHIKANIQEQCEQQAALSRGEVDAKNEHWAQYKMVGRGAYGFVQWSGYRISASDIVAVGFGAAVLRDSRTATTCAWHGQDGKSIAGQPQILYPLNKSAKWQYEPILIKCTLAGKVATRLGGHASVALDKEHMVVYKEPDDGPITRLLSESAHDYKATFCTYPVAEAVDGERMREWLDLHKFMGAEHVVAYDAGGLDKVAMGHLQGYLKSGFLEMTPMREVAQYNLKGHGKLVAMHDCLYRSALSSAWVLFLGWDDVLMLQSPRFLSILLDDHKDKPWMSYGCRMYSTKLCLATSAVKGSNRGFSGSAKGLVPFPQERMVYHWPHFLCPDDYKGEKNKCPGDGGMQYIIANPQKVTLLKDSEVAEPKEGGVQLSADDVRHDRYEGLHLQGLSEKWCKESHGPDDKIEWWAKSLEIASLAEEVRRGLEGKNQEKKP